MKQVTITQVEQESPLVLASFAVPPTSSSMDFHVYGKTSTSKDPPAFKALLKKRRLLVAESHKLEYVGEASSNTYCKYAVGILDKKTGNVTLVEAPSVSVSTIVKKHKPVSDRAISRNSEARDALGQAFGTKKRKQAIRAKEKNQVDIESLQGVAHKINNTIADNASHLPSKADIEADMVQSKLTPPCNKDASLPQDVYALEEIVPPSVLESIDIKRIVKTRLVNNIKESLSSLNIIDWVWSRIEENIKDQGDAFTLRKLLFLAYMMRFLKLTAYEVNKPNIAEKSFSGASPSVIDYLAGLFTEVQTENGKTKRRLTARHKDKLFCYILALILHLSKFSVEVADIASGMGVSAVRVTKMAKELGCRIEGTGASKRVVLALPLSFPTRTR